MAKGGGNKKIFQYCTDSSGQEILYLRALQGHSGRNPMDPSLQDIVLIPDNFFEYIYHIGCAINLHSIMNSGLIPGGQNLSKRQTVFFMPVDPMNKEHKDSDTVGLKAPRLARYLQTAWKKHQNTVYWVDIKLAQKKRFKFYQTRSTAIILQHTPSLLYPEGYQDGNWRKPYTRKYMRHPGLLRRFPLKTIGCRNWVQKLQDIVKTPNKPNPTKDHKSNCENRATCFDRTSIRFECSENRRTFLAWLRKHQ